MNLGFRHIFTAFFSLFISMMASAQEIPVLPDDPAVLKGVAPNGMSYYIVSNPTIKGMADFALVQKTGRFTTEDSTGMAAVTAAKDAMSSLKRIPKSSPKEYLARKGVVPGYGGFVEITDDATVFRFPDVRLDGDAIDSTLLVILDIADRANNEDDEFLKKWYSPADQAVIVAGDVDSKTVASKLKQMSYMVPSRESSPRPEYVKKNENPSVFSTENDGSAVEISATWTSERVPREYMNTVQPEIFEMTLHALGDVAVARIKRALREIDVPAADVSYSHICSSSYPYDDSFTVSAVVNVQDSEKAREVMTEVMASIDAEGAGTDEYVLAETDYLLSLEDMVVEPLKLNEEYVDRCMNAFLYNSSLASPKERLAFHTSRALPDTMRTRLFNGIVKALVTGLDDVTAGGDNALAINVSDSMSLPEPGARVRLKSTKKEHVSGGSVWTFSNGFKVIYKQMPSDRVYYNLALNGGYGNLAGLDKGEGAFLKDYMGTCRIGGMKSADFMDMLKRENVTMDVDVNMSNTMISGHLPKDRMSLLLRALLAVANERTGDAEDFEYYKKSEYMALDRAEGSFEARMTAIDSIMCPDYRYSPYKVKGCISDDFMRKAESFYDSRFARMNDGALVIVGNMDEEQLKKILMMYVGGFRTSDAVLRRPAVHYQPVSGWSTYTVDGISDNVDVAMSARMPLTMDNYIAAALASMVVRNRLAKELSASEMSVELTYNCRIYPEERLNMLISVPEASLNTLADIRSVLVDLPKMDITPAELKPFKETLKNSIALEMKTPLYWTYAIVLRYLDGKDFSTNYAAKIDSMSPDKVMSVLDLLNEGSKIEYVTIKK